MSLSIGLIQGLDPEFIHRDLVAINKVLEAHDLPIYTESSVPFDKTLSLLQISWPYSTIHYLRYIAAKFIENPNWTLDTSEQHRYKIPTSLFNEICRERCSHLICHSDFDGYYIPMDFEKVIFDEKGGWLGSSVQLCFELRVLANKLKVHLPEEPLELELLREMRKDEIESSPFGHQKWILLCMHNIASASVKYGSAIYFR